MKGFRIATLFGIPLEINPSWIIIAALLLWSLSSGIFPLILPGGAGSTYFLMGLVTALLFFGSIVAHELSHSLVSRSYGLEVRRIVLFVFGGVSETTQELPSPKIELQVAIAGPLMSFLLAGVFAILARGFEMLTGGAPAMVVATWLSVVNLALGLFNLLPGFPLDGGRVLRATVWRATGDLRKATRIAAGAGRGVAILLGLWAFVRLMMGDLVGAIWIGLLATLLYQAAGNQYTQMVLSTALSQVGVTQLMSREPVVLSPHQSLQEVIEGTFSHYPYGGYPVAEDHVEGVLQIQQVRDVPPSEWPTVRVGDVMTPIDEAKALTPDSTAAQAVERFNELGVDRLPVIAHDEVVGLVSQSDVIRWIAWHPAEREESKR